MDYHNSQLKDSLEWGTLKNYFTTQNYIEQFLQQRLRKKDIYLSELSFRFITELEMYLCGYQPKDHRKPMGNNTVMKHIEHLRKVVNLFQGRTFHSFRLSLPNHYGP